MMVSGFRTGTRDRGALVPFLEDTRAEQFLTTNFFFPKLNLFPL